MRKRLFLLALALSLSGCGQQEESIQVFAAASLTDVMDTLIQTYTADHPDTTIVATYDSSGTLRRQIDEGATCDIFLSASWTQVENLDATALLENQLVLVVPAHGSGQFSFDTLVSGDFSLLSIGNSDVPAGAYAMEVLDSLNISLHDLESQGKISYGSNVKEVLTQVEESMVDCAMVYATDMAGSTAQIVAVADSAWYSPAIYPLATLSHDAATEGFASFLQGEEAGNIFIDAGFSLSD